MEGRHTKLATETVVGVIFSVALAIGSMATTGEELIEALFGSAEALSLPEVLFGSPVLPLSLLSS